MPRSSPPGTRSRAQDPAVTGAPDAWVPDGARPLLSGVSLAFTRLKRQRGSTPRRSHGAERPPSCVGSEDSEKSPAIWLPYL